MGPSQILTFGDLADQVRHLTANVPPLPDQVAAEASARPAGVATHIAASGTPAGSPTPPDGPDVARDDVATPMGEQAHRPAATIAVDHALVAEVRREVSDALALRLREAPVADPRARRELARTLLTEVLVARSRERVHAGQRPWTVDEEFAIADSVMDAIFGMGRLQPLIDDPSIENIEVTGHDQVWIAHADGREVRGEPVAGSDTELVELIQALVTRTGQAERSFSTASPTLHLRLDDGSRLTAMAWVTPRPVVVIRRHRVRDVSLGQMVEWGSMSSAVAEFLGAAIRAGKNIIVTGAQNAGKTTLLRALAAEFTPMERFATIEREYELHLHELTERHPRVVAMEARIGSSERDASGRASGEVTLSDLVVDALRMNVRRVIVGEVRGPEVVPMLNAMLSKPDPEPGCAA